MFQHRTLILFITNCGGLQLHHHSINDHHQCLYNHCLLRHDHQEIRGAAIHHCSCMNMSSRVSAEFLVGRGTSTNNQMDQFFVVGSLNSIHLVDDHVTKIPNVCWLHTKLTTPFGLTLAKQPLLDLLMYNIKSST